MKRVYNEFSITTTQLQGKLNNILLGITSRGVSLSGQAHSGLVCTILITVSGVRGSMSKTLVMVGDKEVDKKGVRKWNAYVNGYAYELSNMSELKVAITQQISLLKPHVQAK